jgi:hypothetical protein
LGAIRAFCFQLVTVVCETFTAITRVPSGTPTNQKTYPKFHSRRGAGEPFFWLPGEIFSDRSIFSTFAVQRVFGAPPALTAALLILLTNYII